MRSALMFAAMTLVACGAGGGPEFTLSDGEGIKPIEGSVEVTIDTSTFHCGDTLPAGSKSVTTRVVTGGCEFSFDDSVEILKASDFASIKGLKESASLVKRVELDVERLDLLDVTTAPGTKLDVATRVTSVNLTVSGQVVIPDKAALTNLPLTVPLQGEPLERVKSAIKSQSAVAMPVKGVAVLPDEPAVPGKLRIEYRVVPAVVMGVPGFTF